MVPIEAETAKGGANNSEGLSGVVSAQITRDIEVTAKVSLVPFGALPRAEGKARRVFRKDL